MDRPITSRELDVDRDGIFPQNRNTLQMKPAWPFILRLLSALSPTSKGLSPPLRHQFPSHVKPYPTILTAHPTLITRFADDHTPNVL